MSQIVRDLLDGGAPLEEIERLLQQWGGLPLYVPRTVDASHPIVTFGGPTVAAVLSRLYGGDRPIMPLGASLRREHLRRQMDQLAEAGLNNVQIARRLGVHLRKVQRLRGTPSPAVARPARDDRQLELDIP